MRNSLTATWHAIKYSRGGNEEIESEKGRGKQKFYWNEMFQRMWVENSL